MGAGFIYVTVYRTELRWTMVYTTIKIVNCKELGKWWMRLGILLSKVGRDEWNEIELAKMWGKVE